MIAAAKSAVAAVLLDEGRTAHSTVKIPIPALRIAQDFLDTDFII